MLPPMYLKKLGSILESFKSSSEILWMMKVHPEVHWWWAMRSHMSWQLCWQLNLQSNEFWARFLISFKLMSIWRIFYICTSPLYTQTKISNHIRHAYVSTLSCFDTKSLFVLIEGVACHTVIVPNMWILWYGKKGV